MLIANTTIPSTETGPPPGADPRELERRELERRELEPKTGGIWWIPQVNQSILEQPSWVTFDLETVLMDTLRSSPRIQSVSSRTSIAIESIVQQDAAFDSSILFDTGIGRVNDPVGNELTTGGPPRLIDDTLNARAGVRRTTSAGRRLIWYKTSERKTAIASSAIQRTRAIRDLHSA